MHRRRRFHLFWLWVLLLGLAGGSLMLVSCATSGAKPGSPPKPGQGLVEYRKLTQGARERVYDTLHALEALAQPAAQAPHPALPQFDEALHHLEVRSVMKRARAEAIRARGTAYFEEWKAHLPPPDTAEGRAMLEHYNRLHERFEAVRAASDVTREEFKPYLPALRELRESLETAANPPADELKRTTENGRRLLTSLDNVLVKLDEAAVEVRSAIRPAVNP